MLTTIGTVGSDGRLIAPRCVGALARPGLRASSADGRVIERFGEEPTAFYLFGAGHVGRALVVALAPLPFAVTWFDPRPGAIPEHSPRTSRRSGMAIRPNCSAARPMARSSPS